MEAILSMHERHALKKNHVLFPVVLGIVIVFALATSFWYGFDRPEAVGKLLAAKAARAATCPG